MESHIPLSPEVVLYLKGVRKIFHSLVLKQSLNSCHWFEFTETFSSIEELLTDQSPDTLAKSTGGQVDIYFHYGKTSYEFTGYITQVVMDTIDSPSGFPINRVKYIGSGAICLLQDMPSMASFADGKLKGIVSDTCSPYKKTLPIECHPKCKEVVPFALRYKESSFDFLNRLSFIYNELFFFDGRKLIFGTPSDTSEVKLTYDEEITKIRTSARVLPLSLSQYQYLPEEHRKVFAQRTQQPNDNNTILNPLVKQSQFFHTQGGILPLQTPISVDYQADDLLQSHYKGILGQMHFIEGESRTSAVRIGGLIRIHFSEKYNLGKEIGVYRVISVEHYIEKEGSYCNRFVAVPKGLEYPLVSPMVVAYPEIAQVVDNNDPKGQGRVKVAFLWQQQRQESTHWIRVQTPSAGAFDNDSADRGFAFLPEIGDQVMVGFEHGDPHQPFVMGSLFHGENSKAINSETKTLTTRSGHRITFDDSKNSERITIQDKNGNTIDLDSRTNSIKINALENITLQSKQINIEASEHLHIKVKGNMLTEVAQGYNLSAENYLSRIQETTEFITRQKSSLVSQEMNLFTSGGDLRIIAGGKTYVQGSRGVNLDLNEGDYKAGEGEGEKQEKKTNGSSLDLSM